METQQIKIDLLEPNAGQIDGLPENPREWSEEEEINLANSLNETPELFKARPIIAIPHGDVFVVLGGNLRLAASKRNGAKTCPVFVLPKETPASKLKEIVIKDNGSFGYWSNYKLRKDWGGSPLPSWGVKDVFDAVGDVENVLEKKCGEVKINEADETCAVRVVCPSIRARIDLIKELEAKGYECECL